MAAAKTSPSDLYTPTGVEYPTHTTPHNQVVIATIPDPSSDVMDNYLQLKQERLLSTEDVARSVEVQDPALADYLRANLDSYESSKAAKPEVKLLTELAINPLSTPEERDAIKAGDPVNPPVVPANTEDGGAHAAPSA